MFASDQIRHAQDQSGHVLSTDQLAKAIVAAQQELAQQQQRQLQQQQQLQQQHMARVHGVHITSQTATKAAKGVAWLAIVPVMLVLIISGVISAVVMRQVDRATDAVEGAFGGGGNTDASQPGIRWDPNGIPPLVTTVGGEDAVVGRMRTSDGSDLLSIDAYSMDGERLWRIGELGTYSEAYQAVHVGMVADHVIVSDGKSRVRVFDRDTGKQAHSVALTDNVKRICSPMEAPAGAKVDEPGKVWFEQIDERKFYLDPASGALSDAEAKPEWCINERERKFMAGRRPDPLAAAPEVDGVKLERVHVDGDLGVAMGIKTPGTQVPRAVGFDPKTKEITWDIVVSQVQKGSLRNNSTDHSGLAGGRFAATYGEGQDKWHVAAFDAKDGTLLWDETLRGVFAVDWLQGFAMTEDYVLIVRMSSVEVRDAKTGKLKVVIGHESYDDSM